MRVHVEWLWPLAFALIAYAATGVALVVSRWRYDRRRRLLARVERAVADASSVDGGVSPDGLSALSGASVSDVRRLAAESRTPRAADQVLAEYLVGALGFDRIEALAANRTGRTSRWTQITALRVLALARPREGIVALARATSSPDSEVVAAAVTTLGGMRDPEAAAALVHTLTTKAFSPSRVATFLDRFPVDISFLVRPLVSEASKTSRFWGALLLRRYSAAPWAVEALARLAMDPDFMVRKAALQSIASVDSPVTLTVAAEGLRDPVWFVRAHAARALGARRASAHAADVAALLSDRQWWVREAAKQALVQMGPEVEGALIPVLTHVDRFARNSAAEVLQQIGTFQRLLAAETLAPGDPARRETLRQLRLAGDHRLARATIQALPQDLQLRARDVLRTCARPDALHGA